MIPVSKEKIEMFTEKGWWGNKTILDILMENAGKRPDEEALVDPYNREVLMGGKPKRLTYRQLLLAVDRIALGFSELGLGKDDVIVVQLPNVVENVLVYFAAARIGAIVSPLSMMSRQRELGHALEGTEAKALVTVKEFGGFDHLSLAEEFKNGSGFLKHIILAGPDSGDCPGIESFIDTPLEEKYPKAYLEGRQSGPNEIFTICWTSGTEADPKGVPRTHNHWISIAKVVVEGCLVEENHNIHGTFPVINMAGIGGLMVPWVLTGGKFVLHHPFDIEVFFGQMAKENLYYTLMPPALLDTLAKSPKAELIGKTNVKVIASGSVPLSPWMVRFYQEKLDISIVNFFASNEGIALFSGPRLFPSPDDRAQFFPRFGGDGVSLTISDDVIGGMESCLMDPLKKKEIKEPGVVGELCFKGPTMFEGYWKREDLSSKSFDENGFYHSGDLFSIEGDTKDKYLFHGRFKDLIIRGGQNISPEEVEVIVSAHPKIQEVAAVGYPDSRLGEKTCVFVVPKPEMEVTLPDITGFMEEQGVAKYKFPERLEIIETLPRSALNKVLRRKLRDRVKL